MEPDWAKDQEWSKVHYSHCNCHTINMMMNFRGSGVKEHFVQFALFSTRTSDQQETRRKLHQTRLTLLLIGDEFVAIINIITP